MAEPKIVQSKQSRSPKKVVNIDGHTWEYIEPGMGTQSRLSQHMARIKLYSKRVANLDVKIDNDSITEEELENYETYLDKVESHQAAIIEIFSSVYRDGSKDNAAVLEWLDKTPPWKLEKAFEEIARQDTNDGEKATTEDSKS